MDCKIKTNAIFNLAYQILAILIPLVTMPYVSRVLGVEKVGVQSYTLSIVSYFTLFAAFGLNDYGQREIARYRNDKTKISKLFWELCSNRLLTSLLVISTYLVLIFTCLEKNYELYYLIMVMNILAITFDIAWFFQGMEKFKTLAIRNTVIKLLGLVGIFLFVRNENDLWLYILINSLSLILSALSIWFVVPKYVERARIEIKSVFVHYKGALVYFIPAIAIQIYTILDKSMIQWITGSTVENGVYEQAEKIGKISLTIIQIMNSIMISRMSYLFEHGEEKEAKDLCVSSMKFLSLLMYPMIAGVILVAPNLIPMYLGPGYEKSIILLQIFAFLILFIGLSGFIGSHYMTPIGKQRKSNIALIIGAIFNFCLNLILIPKFASIGAAIASVCAEGIIAILYLYNARKFIKPYEFLQVGYKNIIATIVMFVGVYFMGQCLNFADIWVFVIKIGSGVILYFAMLLILKDRFLIETLRYGLNVLRRTKNN